MINNDVLEPPTAEDLLTAVRQVVEDLTNSDISYEIAGVRLGLLSQILLNPLAASSALGMCHCGHDLAYFLRDDNHLYMCCSGPTPHCVMVA